MAIKRCRSCGIPLRLAWLLMAAPWQPRVRRFADAADCVDLLSRNVQSEALLGFDWGDHWDALPDPDAVDSAKARYV